MSTAFLFEFRNFVYLLYLLVDKELKTEYNDYELNEPQNQLDAF